MINCTSLDGGSLHLMRLLLRLGMNVIVIYMVDVEQLKLTYLPQILLLIRDPRGVIASRLKLGRRSPPTLQSRVKSKIDIVSVCLYFIPTAK